MSADLSAQLHRTTFGWLGALPYERCQASAALEAFELILAPIFERQTRSCEKATDRARYEHFSWLRHRQYARSNVHRDSAHLVALELHFDGVNAGTRPYVNGYRRVDHGCRAPDQSAPGCRGGRESRGLSTVRGQSGWSNRFRRSCTMRSYEPTQPHRESERLPLLGLSRCLRTMVGEASSRCLGFGKYPADVVRIAVLNG